MGRGDQDKRERRAREQIDKALARRDLESAVDVVLAARRAIGPRQRRTAVLAMRPLGGRVAGHPRASPANNGPVEKEISAVAA